MERKHTLRSWFISKVLKENDLQRRLAFAMDPKVELEEIWSMLASNLDEDHDAFLTVQALDALDFDVEAIIEAAL